MILHFVVGLLTTRLVFCDAKTNNLVRRATRAVSSSSNSTLSLPPIPSTWKTLNLDEYLLNYPGGATLSLRDYAFSNRAQNFICGIGEGCNAGQIGNPVQKPAWYILYAAQEYNAVQNYIYTAIGFAVSMMQATAASMVTDLYVEKPRSLLFQLADLFAVVSALAFSVAIVGFFVATGAAWVIAAVVAAALAAGTSTVLTGLNIYHSFDRHPDNFTRWSTYAYYLSEWQSKVQDKMASIVDKTFESGISSPSGIYSVLKGGVFLDNTKIERTENVQKQLEDTLTVRLAVNILRSQGGFVTYNYDKCGRKGPGGAWRGDDVLSHCKDGKMINIVRADGHKTQNHWPNAYLIQKKYNISTEYLVTQSVNCFFKYRKQNFDPYVNSTLPLDVNADCVANLPVCDITRSEINHEIKRGSTTVVACSKYGVPMNKN